MRCESRPSEVRLERDGVIGGGNHSGGRGEVELATHGWSLVVVKDVQR